MVRLLLLAIVIAGCGDDRIRVGSTIFRCDPTSPTADFDCGAGYLCYSAAEAMGGSFCAPKCDPKLPKSCPNGTCTVGGTCLRHCKIERDDCGNDASPLHCVRSSVGPYPDGTNGVCMLVADTCGDSSECTSPIFDLCTSAIFLSDPNAYLTGNACIQGGCVRRGVACAPGSTCVPTLLGVSGPGVPDGCTPNCAVREVDGESVNECVIGLGCLTDIYPQSGVRACAPGFTGWPCKRNLTCLTGMCVGYQDIDARLDGVSACATSCTTDEDCLHADGGPGAGTPNFLTKMTCRAGSCRALVTMLFPEVCFDVGAHACRLDPAALCAAQDPSQPREGPQGICKRTCTSDDECARLTEGSGVPHHCDKGVCGPAVPFFSGCSRDEHCLAGLSCIPTPMGSQCTRRCASSQDCATTPTLGSVFACFAGICIPRTPSGNAPPAPIDELCLGGKRSPSSDKCVSPNGWTCSDNPHCASGVCNDAKRCQ